MARLAIAFTFLLISSALLSCESASILDQTALTQGDIDGAVRLAFKFIKLLAVGLSSPPAAAEEAAGDPVADPELVLSPFVFENATTEATTTTTSTTTTEIPKPIENEIIEEEEEEEDEDEDEDEDEEEEEEEEEVEEDVPATAEPDPGEEEFEEEVTEFVEVEDTS
jgi:hypothetical protein